MRLEEKKKHLCCNLALLCCLWSLVVFFQAYFGKKLKSLQSLLLLDAHGQSWHADSLRAPLATAELSSYFSWIGEIAQPQRRRSLCFTFCACVLLASSLLCLQVVS